MKESFDEKDIEDENKNKNEINILILGYEKVGKTSLTSKYTGNDFYSRQLNKAGQIGLNQGVKTIEKNGKKYKLILTDLSPHISYETLNFKYNGVILVYDITQEESIDYISDLIDDLREKKGKNFPMILLGNKVDNEKERCVDEEFGINFANKNYIDFFEISCEKGTNLDIAVDTIFNKILKVLELDKSDDKKDDSCCCDCCCRCFH